MTTSKNDRNGVRTAQDLERKYDLKGLKRQITEGLSGIKKVDNELMEFIKTTVAEFGEIQTELDGKIEEGYITRHLIYNEKPAQMLLSDGTSVGYEQMTLQDYMGQMGIAQ